MEKQELNNLLDKVIGIKGDLKVPSYWMNKTLKSIIEYNDNLIKTNINSIPSIPTNISYFNNDVSYATEDFVFNHVDYNLNSSSTIPISNSTVTTKIYSLDNSINELNRLLSVSSSEFQFVDLGLPSGLKWASWNIGASSPVEPGLYFAWGETQGYERITESKKFTWEDYELCNDSQNSLIKYSTQTGYNVKDDLSILEQIDDAAYQTDNICRMPTQDDVQELFGNTDSYFETFNGVGGIRLVSKINHNSIFIPFGGRLEEGLNKKNLQIVQLWTATLDSNYPYRAKMFIIQSDGSISCEPLNRYLGCNIRAVQEANKNQLLNPSEITNIKDSIDIPNGVYIVDLYGNVYDVDNYTGEDATGVALITDKVKLIVSLDEWYGQSTSYWGGYQYNVNGCFSGSNHLQDFNGEANTNAIITELDGVTDSQGIVGSPIATYCKNYSRGCKGAGQWYLPSAGELNEVILNKDAINKVLRIIGNKELGNPSGYIWTSSQRDSASAWAYKWNNNSNWFLASKRNTAGVRSVCKLGTPSLINVIRKLETDVSKLQTNIYPKEEINELVSEFRNGVYAVSPDNKLIDYNSADSSCIGVALIVNEHKFMIAKEDATDGTNTTFYWGKNEEVAGLAINKLLYGTNDQGYGYFDDTKTLTLSKNHTYWKVGALSEFNGKANTEAIIASYTEQNVDMDTRDMCSVLATFNNSNNNDWYIPSLGQIALIYLNMTEINTALEKIGGTALASETYWSSTQSYSSYAYCIAFNNGYIHKYVKTGSPGYRVRFARNILTKSLKDRVSNLESQIGDINTILESMING